MYIIQNNIEACEEPVLRTKKTPQTTFSQKDKVGNNGINANFVFLSYTESHSTKTFIGEQ